MNTTLTIYLNKEDKERLFEIAKKKRMTVSTYCKDQLLNSLEEPERITP